MTSLDSRVFKQVEKATEDQLVENINFDAMRVGTLFWVVHVKEVTFNDKFKGNGEQKTTKVWTVAMQKPTADPFAGCLKYTSLKKMWQGARTMWMDAIPAEIVEKINNKQMAMEVRFDGQTSQQSKIVTCTKRLMEYDEKYSKNVDQVDSKRKTDDRSKVKSSKKPKPEPVVVVEPVVAEEDEEVVDDPENEDEEAKVYDSE